MACILPKTEKIYLLSEIAKVTCIYKLAKFIYLILFSNLHNIQFQRSVWLTRVGRSAKGYHNYWWF